MIRFTTGDLLQAETDALVNTVNCVGVMGRGIALQFKRAFPANFDAYAAACERGEVQPGRVLVHETGQLTPPRFIVNFPTKRHWRAASRLDDIRAGLAALVEVIGAHGIRSIALPPLGCGLGGLDWRAVRPLIEAAMAALPAVEVVVFEPDGAAAPRPAPASNPPELTPGRAALLALMHRHRCFSTEPDVTLLEVHKLLYFLQLAGEPLRLRWRKAAYGPYAENLRLVLQAVEGHFITGYTDGRDAPHKPLAPMPGAVEQAQAVLAAQPDTAARLARVVALADGFESGYGLELLATVHWVAAREGAADVSAAVAGVQGWSARKRRFDADHIAVAWERLASGGWLGEAGRG